MRFFVTVSFFVFIVSSLIPAYAQRGLQWSKRGDVYYVTEGNAVVAYNLPSFQKKIVIDSSRLLPKGGTDPLQIRSFLFDEKEEKVLIFTNTKKVWRFDTRGDYWLFDLADGSLKQLGKSRPPSSLMFAKISPDGRKAAYVSGHNIYVEDLTNGLTTALTRDGTKRLINGTFDWAYEEEFGCRDGFRWSADSRNIAYWQIDARKIKNFLLINNTDSLYSFTIPVEYPKVGENPSPARVGVVNVGTGKTKWMQVPGNPQQHYIPRMEWAANNTELVLQQLNRKQNEANIFLCNITTGAANLIYKERSDTWIDVKATWSSGFAGWEWINNGKEFLWVTEKDGWRHIYRIDRSGKETLLTKGSYDIIDLLSIDEKNGLIYFIASPDNATQRYLYSVRLDGTEQLARLSPRSQTGTHRYNISPDAQFANHIFSNITNERRSEWVRIPSHEVVKINEQPTPGNDSISVEMFQVTTEDGVTMDGWMVKPKNFDSTKKYPVVFHVYAEPAGTTVTDAAGSASTTLYAGDMAKDGYISMSIEGRGTPAPKGAAWRKAIYRKVGVVNTRDQAMGAKKIMQWSFVDTSRIAVWGWSGGASTTLNLLFQYPGIYKTGIAIAPVPNQLLYDNIYQERYMGLPQENKDDYLRGSPITHAKNFRGNLLLIHGTGDDNVHYQGTEMLINELVKHGKQFQLMSYPNRTHSINEGEGTTKHLSQLFTAFLREHCPGGPR